jgi:hypothetical protein
MNKLDKEQVEWLINETNRSKNQTQELFELCDYDWEKLKKVEVQIKNCFIFYCPGDKKTIDYVLGLKPLIDSFKLK